MSITKILGNEDTSADEKISQVSEVIAQVRAKYGNEDVEIDTVKVSTTMGMMDFSFLESDSKVEILKHQAIKIKAEAVEYVEQTPGANAQRKVEELLATNPMFANLANGVTFDYL